MTKTFDGKHTSRSGFVSETDHQNKDRSDKITNMQRLIDEGLESGISDSSMDDILAKSMSRHNVLKASD